MRIIICFFVTLAIAGCGSADYYKSPSDIARDNAFDDAAAAGIIAGGFHHQTTCMNIGGIVTCQ